MVLLINLFDPCYLFKNVLKTLKYLGQPAYLNFKDSLNYILLTTRSEYRLMHELQVNERTCLMNSSIVLKGTYLS